MHCGHPTLRPRKEQSWSPVRTLDDPLPTHRRLNWSQLGWLTWPGWYATRRYQPGGRSWSSSCCSPLAAGAAVLGSGGNAGGTSAIRRQRRIASRPSARSTLAARAGAAREVNLVVAGITTSLSNPYWLLWWVTIGLGYVAMGLEHGWPGIVAFFAGHIAADFAWYTFVSSGLTVGRRFLDDRLYRGLVAVCGLALVYFGAAFVTSGIEGVLL